MKHLLIALTIFVLSSCTKDDIYENKEPLIETEEPEDNSNSDDNNDKENEKNQMTIKIGDKTYSAILESNNTATSFKEMLPLSLDMAEMNGNEKYAYLKSYLPTAPISIGTINKGDIMLYGSNCIVVFYKTFNTSYSYTRIGRIDKAEDLNLTVGSGSTTITFE